MTKSNPDGTWNVIGSSGDIVPWNDIPKELYGALCKLHAYEKTRLNPETVEIIRDENEQLCEGILQLNKRVEELQDILDGSVDIDER